MHQRHQGLDHSACECTASPSELDNLTAA